MTAGPVRTVSGALNRLDAEFSQFRVAFADGQYVLWLGSGISRERVPNVAVLLELIIEFLRARIDQAAESCEYRTALNKVLGHASLTNDEQATLNTELPFETWPLRERISAVLVNRYAEVLDVRVGQNAPDFLVWDVLDVPQTYGSPDIEPDVEHYCIALLMLEGLVSSAVTANWDGLVEKALSELMPTYDALVRVVVRPEDFHLPNRQIDFIKFHGCAVRARESDEYRSLLIARNSQISTWATPQQPHSAVRKRLELLYGERLTLMLGLSAQDANLQYVFGAAIEDLARRWLPTEAPATVLSEEALLSHHENVLRITYGADYEEHTAAIDDSAVLGSFGKPTLLALVLSTLTSKLKFLMEQVLDSGWSSSEVDELSAQLHALRDYAADLADPPNREKLKFSEIFDYQRAYLSQLIDLVNLALSQFRTGHSPAEGDRRYKPLSDRPIAQTIHNADFPTKQFGRLGVALALVGRGVVSDAWAIKHGGTKAPEDGAIRLGMEHRDSRVFFLKDSAALTRLELEGLYDENDKDVLVVVADEEPTPATRSSRARFGRDGQIGVARFNVATSLATTESADDLYEAFKLAGGF